MDDEQVAVVAFDRHDLEWLFVLVIAEEVEPGFSLPPGSVLETDAGLLKDVESPPSRYAMPSRRSRPADSFAVDPLILSDDISSTSAGPQGFGEQIVGVHLFVGDAAHEFVGATT